MFFRSYRFHFHCSVIRLSARVMYAWWKKVFPSSIVKSYENTHKTRDLAYICHVHVIQGKSLIIQSKRIGNCIKKNQWFSFTSFNLVKAHWLQVHSANPPENYLSETLSMTRRGKKHLKTPPPTQHRFILVMTLKRKYKIQRKCESPSIASRRLCEIFVVSVKMNAGRDAVGFEILHGGNTIQNAVAVTPCNDYL